MFLKPTRLPFNEAAILEPLSCVVHGLEHLDFDPEDTVLIIGAGAIGLMHLLLLRTLGLERVVIAGRRAFRLRVAQELGAARVIDAENEDVREIILDLTHGRGADLVIECTGRPAVWQQAITLVRRGGKVVLFGGCPSGSTIELDTGRIHYDQITLISPFHYTQRAVRRAYELLCERRIEVGRLITGEYPLTRLPEVFTLLQQGNCIKYAVIP